MSVRYAILADVHGNLEALEAVLGDLSANVKPDKVVVLGDTIGYGPNPRECLERVFRAADLVLIGNHESDLIQPDPAMSRDAREVLDWTAEQIRESPAWKRVLAEVRMSGHLSLARRSLDGMEFVHGSPRKPVEQYIWPAHDCQYIVYNDQIDERLQDFLWEFPSDFGFCAHTHQPAVLTGYADRAIFDPYRAELNWNRRTTFVGPKTVFFVPEGNALLYGLAGKKAVINPGSVGQPRDGNPAASYALFDGSTLCFRRVPYDFRKTQEKIRALPLNPETCEGLAARLEKGE
jgi:predicted phosphodiesterase